MSDPSFRASLEERTGLSARELSARMPAEIDPLFYDQPYYLAPVAGAASSWL